MHVMVDRIAERTEHWAGFRAPNRGQQLYKIDSVYLPSLYTNDLRIVIIPVLVDSQELAYYDKSSMSRRSHDKDVVT